MVIQHKCPSCGADMKFDTASGLLHCESCGYEENIKQMENQAEASENASAGSYDEFLAKTSRNTYSDNSAIQYQCKNCGAVLITDELTTATTCSFCDAPMILGDRLRGELAPSKVIPFKISKEEAEKAFKKWCGKSILLPRDFKKANRLKSITGIYVPFWLFTMHTRGEVNAECTKVRHYSKGDYDITETKYFDVYRDVDLHFDKIPVDASIKMDDKMMDKLEPFNYNELYDFNTPYLAGYLAEKYDYTDRDLYPRIEKRTENYTLDFVRQTMIGYDGKIILNQNIQMKPEDAIYALLPIWMFCYDYQHAEHNFVMNGQTGKIIGKPPISKKNCAAIFVAIAIISFFLIKLIAYMIGGVWVW